LNPNEIEKEIELLPEESPSRGLHRTLSNMHFLFPAGDKPTVMENQEIALKGVSAWFASMIGHPDTPHWKLLASGMDGDHSEIWKNQSHEQFLAEVSKTVDEVKVDRDRLTVMVNKRIRCPEGEEDTVAECLYELLRPIYVALRMKGYSRLDIIA